MEKKILEKIMQRQEYSRLPQRDVLEILEKVRGEDVDVVKRVRDLLQKAYTSFASKKLFSLRKRDIDWYLLRHRSTKERIKFYSEIYSRIFGSIRGKYSIVDFGCGVNSFSYQFFPGKFNYLGIEAMGQLVDLQNFYFNKRKVSFVKVIHESLFDLEKIKKIVSETSSPRIGLLFKVVDSLEMVERDYSKKFILELAQYFKKMVVSFATKSLISRKRIFANKKWLLDFLRDNFLILDDFSLGDERYVVFSLR